MSESELEPRIFGNLTAKEAGKRGGSMETPAKTFGKIRKCTKKCPIFPCFAMPMSKDKYDNNCALKKLPKKITDRTFKIMLKGEEGLNTVLLQILADVGFSSISTKDKRAFLHDTISVKKSIYGDKSRVEQKIETNALEVLSGLFNNDKSKKSEST